MKAILVGVSLLTRVIVPDDFNVDNLSDEDYKTLREKAWPKFHDKLNTEGVGDCIDQIDDDEESPFDENDERDTNEAKS